MYFSNNQRILITMADRSRSITWSDERRKMVNLVAAHYDMTTEAFIRACITSGLLSMGTSDRLLALALCEIAESRFRT